MRSAENSNGAAFTLLRCGNLYVFQHRDNIPTISSPGLFAAFGGALEDGEEPGQAAARELAEETSLGISEQELRYLGCLASPRFIGLRYAFQAEIDTTDFATQEGQGKAVFATEQLATCDMNSFSPSTGIAIQKYILMAV